MSQDLYIPLFRDEENFLMLHNLTLRSFTTYGIVARQASGKDILLDRTLSFDHWSALLRGMILTYNGVTIPDPNA